MRWEGTFILGKLYAAYFGKAGDNSLHQHAAIQLVLLLDKDIAVYNAQGTRFAGKCILIRPLAWHALRGHSDLIAVYIEPSSAFGKSLLSKTGPQNISALPDGAEEILTISDPNEILMRLDALHTPVLEQNDIRLSNAMKFLEKAKPASSISEAAKACNISTSTLRALARQELGLPLSTWLIWRKLGHAVKALSLGATLSEAALEGRFADQAHFTRTMKRMFGVTPKTAKGIVTWRSTHET